MTDKKLNFSLHEIFKIPLKGHDSTQYDIQTLSTRVGMVAVKLQECCMTIDDLANRIEKLENK